MGKNREDGVYIIAEAGVNHNGSLAAAKELVQVAKEAGADAVKFQTFQAEDLVTADVEKARYQKETAVSKDTSQLSMLKRLELPLGDFLELAAYAKRLSIDFLSTPFDEKSLSFLAERTYMPYLKIPSGEITNAPFLLACARTKMPILLSTGMSFLGEVEMALAVLAYGYTVRKAPTSLHDFYRAYASDEGQRALSARVCLLHCTTEYPAPVDEVNLSAMDRLRDAFSLRIGYSDHTDGIAVAIAAAARGAMVIEKHFTLDRNQEGPDHKASLDPLELSAMVDGVRKAHRAIGSMVKAPAESEWDNRRVARKSLVAACSIDKGDVFTREHITAKRAGTGRSPLSYWEFLGRRATCAYRKDDLL